MIYSRGVPLIDRVIDAVSADPGLLKPWLSGPREPMAAPDPTLPPSLRAWLAFDGRLPELTPATLTKCVQSIEIRGYEGTDLDEPDDDETSWNDIFSDTSLKGLTRFERAYLLPSPRD